MAFFPGSVAGGMAQGQQQGQQMQMQQQQLAQMLQSMAMQKQQFDQQQQAQQRALAARQGAGQVLFDQFAPPPQPPAPGASSPPGTPNGGQPPPGGSAPGGGMMPPPPQAGPQMSPDPAAQQQQPMPWRPMPTAPAGGGGGAPPPAGGPAQLSPPPAQGQPAAGGDAAQGPGAGVAQPKPFDLKSIVSTLKAQGVPPEKVMDMLDEMAPIMNAQNKQELEVFKVQNQAQKAALEAYHRTILEHQGQQRLEQQAQRDTANQEARSRTADLAEKRFGAMMAKLAGGQDNIKDKEFIYPRGPDGRPDETKEPIAARVFTKSGKTLTLDRNGQQIVGGVDGGSAKEAKDTKGSAGSAVRQSIVKAGVKNSLDRLNEIEKTFGDNTTTSSFFGQSGGNPLTRGLYGAGKSAQSKTQQKADAQWGSFIDEAIPVFTGGLRGSDAFRKFLIEQAPGPGDAPETVKEKRRLYRQNIEGTSKAFFNKFSTDPTMWAAGTKPEEVQSAGGGAAAPQQKGATSDDDLINKYLKK